MKKKCPFCGLVDSHTRICNGAIIPNPKKYRERLVKRKEYEEKLMKRGNLAQYNPNTHSWDLPNLPSKKLLGKFDLKQGLHGKVRKVQDGGSS